MRTIGSGLALARQRQTITHGQHGKINPRVIFDNVIQRADGPRIFILIIPSNDGPTPQDIVNRNK